MESAGGRALIVGCSRTGSLKEMLGLEQKLRDAGAPEAYIQQMLNEQKEASKKKSASRVRIASAITKWWNGTKCGWPLARRAERAS